MQVFAYGIQDVYLTGRPEMTFFRVNYARHTKFASEPIVINTTDNTIHNSSYSVGKIKMEEDKQVQKHKQKTNKMQIKQAMHNQNRNISKKQLKQNFNKQSFRSSGRKR